MNRVGKWALLTFAFAITNGLTFAAAIASWAQERGGFAIANLIGLAVSVAAFLYCSRQYQLAQAEAEEEAHE